MENPQVLKDLLKQNVPIVAPFLKTYETFGHVRRICDIGLEHPLNDSSAFPDIIAQKGLREQNYEIIKVSFGFCFGFLLCYKLQYFNFF